MKEQDGQGIIPSHTEKSHPAPKFSVYELSNYFLGGLLIFMAYQSKVDIPPEARYTLLGLGAFSLLTGASYSVTHNRN